MARRASTRPLAAQSPLQRVSKACDELERLNGVCAGSVEKASWIERLKVRRWFKAPSAAVVLSPDLVQLLQQLTARLSTDLPLLPEVYSTAEPNNVANEQLDGLDDCIRRLKRAIEGSKGRSGSDEASVRRILDELDTYTNEYRLPNFLDQTLKKTVDQALDDGQTQLLSFKTWFNEKYEARAEQPATISLGDLTVPFWQYIHTDNDIAKWIARREPGDGCMIEEEHLNQTKEVLRLFTLALTQAQEEGRIEKTPHLAGLKNTTKLCSVLKYLNSTNAIDTFLEKGWDDDHHLPVKERSALEAIRLRSDEIDEFLAQQYRAWRRDSWNDGNLQMPVTLHPGEPLPFLYSGRLSGQGSYASVELAKDVHSKKMVAHKTCRMKGAGATQHLRNEFQSLITIKSHHHLATMVKSYIRKRTRGSDEEFGIIMTPADCNLEELLKKYWGDGAEFNRFPSYDSARADSFRKNRIEREWEWLQPVLMNTFGCLSHGLAHIHSSNMRHKDIKPDNILVTYEEVCFRKEQLLWADFGLAYYYGERGNARTASDRSDFIHRYSAPEVAQRVQAREGSIQSTPSSSSKITIESSGIPSSRTVDTETSLDGKCIQDHGPPEDVFALGLIFLEVLSALLKEDPSRTDPSRTDPKGFQKCGPLAPGDGFFNHPDELNAWIDSRLNSTDTQPALKPVFRLAKRMVSHAEAERPSSGQVLEVLDTIDRKMIDWASSPEFRRSQGSITYSEERYFCHNCIQDNLKRSQQRTSNSSHIEVIGTSCTGCLIKDCAEGLFAYEHTCNDDRVA